MKHGLAWLIASTILAPALLAWGSDPAPGDSTEKHITPAMVNAHVAWTKEQREKILELSKARAEQIKPLYEQLKQLQEQMRPLVEQVRALNAQFEQSVSSLPTSDQIADAKQRIEHAWEERHLDGQEGATSRPAGQELRRHEWASSRPAGEMHHRSGATSQPAGEMHHHRSSTSQPATVLTPEQRQRLEHEKERIQHELRHVNRELHEKQ